MSDEVFPTHVGMNRPYSICPPDDMRVPHARGDEPQAEALLARISECSPRTWG